MSTGKKQLQVHSNATRTLRHGVGNFTNVLEVVVGVGLKALSNSVRHIAAAPLDPIFRHAEWRKTE